MEVPEIYDATVTIVSVARDAGERSKVAVRSKDRDVDPVGACVGMKGSRVQAVIREIQAREDRHGFVKLPRRQFVPGQSVRITSGSLLGQCGIHQRSTGAERISILLELLGRKVTVQLPETHVEPITTFAIAANSIYKP